MLPEAAARRAACSAGGVSRAGPCPASVLEVVFVCVVACACVFYVPSAPLRSVYGLPCSARKLWLPILLLYLWPSPAQPGGRGARRKRMPPSVGRVGRPASWGRPARGARTAPRPHFTGLCFGVCLPHCLLSAVFHPWTDCAPHRPLACNNLFCSAGGKVRKEERAI